MTSNIQGFGGVIVVMIAALVVGTLSNFGGPKPSRANPKAKNNTTDLPNDLFADRTAKDVDKSPTASATTLFLPYRPMATRAQARSCGPV